MSPATFQQLSDEKKARILIRLVERGDWWHYFNLSANNIGYRQP